MSQPSFEKFDYTLRPAKNVERKMMCDVFARLAAISPLRGYRYVGLGSISCKDFALIHHRLGICDMVSMERERKHAQRFKFNKPYSCIEVRWGPSTEVLPTLKWKKRTIVWLDYDGYLDGDVLADIETVVANIRSGSVLVVTACAKPSSPAQAQAAGNMNVHERRLQQLRERVGLVRIPRGVSGGDLRDWGLAKVQRDIIHNAVVETLSARNGPLSTREELAHQQLFNFHYADGAKMLTVGGLFVNEEDRAKLPGGSFDDLFFVKPGADAYRIEVPVLTSREAMFLDKYLPDKQKALGKKASWLPKQERQRYCRLYRYFPTYVEAEM